MCDEDDVKTKTRTQNVWVENINLTFDMSEVWNYRQHIIVNCVHSIVGLFDKRRQKRTPTKQKKHQEKTIKTPHAHALANKVFDKFSFPLI